jgi:hypothetical protein
MVVSRSLVFCNHHQQLAPPPSTSSYSYNFYDCQEQQQQQPVQPQPLKPHSQSIMPYSAELSRPTSLLPQHPTSAFHMIYHGVQKRPLPPAPSPDLSSSSSSAPLEKKRKLKHKKSVRFADDSCNQIFTRHPYGADDVSNAWMQVSDYQAIRDDNRNTLLELKRVKGHMSLLDDKQYCTQGLEEQISVLLFRNERGFHRKVVQCVIHELNAQQRQYLPFDIIPQKHDITDSIASLYSMLAKPFVQRALYLARGQHQDALHA